MEIYKLDKKHLQQRCEWLNTPSIYENMNMQYPITLFETEKWFERIVVNPNRMDLVFAKEEVPLAMTGITNIDTVNGIAEFYIMVNPNYQGKGIGTEATKQTIDYAFRKYNIHKIYLYTNSFNQAANRLYDKLGFKLEGILRKHKFKNGIFIDRCVYGLLKEEWKNNE